MKISVICLGLLAFLTPLTAAWSKEDREIFRVRDELAQHEGPDVTFYDYLGISSSASQDDISKAYRKQSRSLHPDKVKQQMTVEAAKLKKAAKKNKSKSADVPKPPTNAEIKAAVKAASDRQARLSIVANILRGSGRERYDHFMANGFPVWKGTEYYYNRYRPGLGTVLFGAFLSLGGAAHYLALYMGWKRQRDFVERYIKFARHAAWGDNNLGANLNVPGLDAGAPVGTTTPPPAPTPEEEGRVMPTNRRMKRMQERENKREARQEGSGRRVGRKLAAARAASVSGAATPVEAGPGPQGAKKRVVAENGKILVVDSLGDVYLEQEDEEGNVELFLLDHNEITKPTIHDTALIRVPIWLYGQTVGRVLNKNRTDEDADDFENEELLAAETDSSGAGGKHTPASSGSGDEDYELLDKSVEDVSAAAAKTTGSQPQQSGKNNKRKGKGKKK